jgi:hypothetical protein
MTRHQINRIIGIAPIVMSLIALTLVIVAVTTGWQTNLPDEGAAARLFQLMIFTQPLVVAAFLATADWKRPLWIAGAVGLHVLAAGLALGALFWFEAQGL